MKRFCIGFILLGVALYYFVHQGFLQKQFTHWITQQFDYPIRVEKIALTWEKRPQIRAEVHLVDVALPPLACKSAYPFETVNCRLPQGLEGTFKPKNNQAVIEINKTEIATLLALLPSFDIDPLLLQWLNQSILSGEVTTTILEKNGDIRILSKVEKVDLRYDEAWPALLGLEADLLFHNRRFEIEAKQGTFEGGGTLLNAKGTIADMMAAPSELLIEGAIHADLEEGTALLQKPLFNLNTALFSFTGPMQLQLALAIPLKAELPTRVKGDIALDKANVKAKKGDMLIEGLKGNILFTEQSLKTEKLEGKLKQLNIGLPLSGETDVQIQAQSKDFKQWELSVTSTLMGLAVKGPWPFFKKPEENCPLHLAFSFDPSEVQFLAHYGNNFNAAYAVQFKNNQWNPIGGHLHFGVAPSRLRKDGILLIDGNLAELDLQQWKAFSLSSSPFQLESVLDLEIENFILGAISLGKTKIEAQSQKDTSSWELFLDGSSIQGEVRLTQAKEMMIDLQTLVFDPASVSLTNTKTLSDFQYPIELKIAQFTWGNKKFSELQLRLEPSQSGYDLPYVKANMAGAQMRLSGYWENKEARMVTTGKILTNNMGHTLNALGLGETLQGAKGSLDFSLQWQGSPLKMDMPSLLGKAELVLNRGSLQGVNPGLGRILNVLSLDSVRRRLNFDFTDLTKKGLVFDELAGKFQFGKGKVISNKVTLKSPAAKIEAFGQADLESEGITGEVLVKPYVTGSLPVAAAIAGGPAVGAAVWVVDKILSNQIQTMSQHRYRVLGTWNSPQLQEMERSG